MSAQVTEIENIFSEENFAINKFLSKSTQKNDLETLRSQLKDYGASLHNSMTEIFKTETESILDLAENLSNLDSKIHHLIQPASQLREEILTLYNTIKSNRDSYDNSLEWFEKNQRDRYVLSLKQNLLQAKRNMSITLNNQCAEDKFTGLLNYERVINNYALQLSFAKQLAIEDESILAVEPHLLNNINNELLKALSDLNIDITFRCLQMFVNLSQERQAEKIYREKFLSPKLRSIFSKRNLESLGGDLKKLYDQGLQVLNEDMHFLMTIINNHKDLRSFQFVRNAYWLEVDYQMLDGLGDVTVPGNPNMFQQRFSATWDFLQTVIARCEPSVIASDYLDLHGRVAIHIQRFNLPVYFEIRYQQISSAFETAFVRTTMPNGAYNIYCDNPKLQHKLHITGVLMDCAKLCFSPDIIIPHLSGQFIKLSMLLLIRYLSWFPTYLKQFQALGSSEHQLTLIYILADLALVKDAFGSANPDLTIYNTCEKNLGCILKELLHTNNESMEDTIRTTIKFIVNMKTEEVVALLQNVNAIPRLYRKTNKNTPTKPSNYIADAIDVIDKLQGNFDKRSENVVDAIIGNVATKFFVLVSDVLHSVSKTEESLKRLKRQTGTASAESSKTINTSSDNYKIREQIRLDVGCFVDKFMLSCSESTKTELAGLAKSARYVA